MFQDGTWAVSFLLRPPHRGCFFHRVEPNETGKQLPRSIEATQAISAERTIILPSQEIFFTLLTHQSTSLFSQGFVGTRVHCDNRHNQRRHNEVHALLRALILKAKIHPCCNDNFFVSKICCKIFFLDAVFKWKTLSLFPSPYPSKMKTNNENLNCHHFGSWLFLEIWGAFD